MSFFVKTRERVMLVKSIIVASTVLLTTIAPAFATSGPGCLVVVNVPSWDRLNLRASPRASAPIVQLIHPENHGILHLDRACTPLSRPWGQRWCKVTHYNGDSVRSGYVKARFVRDSDCP
jgi:hypothetical protein